MKDVIHPEAAIGAARPPAVYIMAWAALGLAPGVSEPTPESMLAGQVVDPVYYGSLLSRFAQQLVSVLEQLWARCE